MCLLNNIHIYIVKYIIKKKIKYKKYSNKFYFAKFLLLVTNNYSSIE